MNAHAESLLAIFEAKQCLEIPLFQRQYTWNEEQQWRLLWEDISLKFGEYIGGETEVPPHFLGAIILDQKMTPTVRVTKRQVIDGQQRLTTFQIFLAAFRDYCNAIKHRDLAEECNAFLINKGMLSDLESDRYKIWPTHSDRAQFVDVIDGQSSETLAAKYDGKSRKIPRMIEAYFYFYKAISGYLDEEKDAQDKQLFDKLEGCFRALQNALRVVIIDLAESDDAQVIFETLNGRGQPLLPADLLRNHIFLRALRKREPVEQLHSEYWQKFDVGFWRKKAGRGRQTRPYIDLFFQHFLASKQIKVIPIRHLFMEYKYWIDRSNPFNSVKEELACLSRQGAHFSRIINPSDSDPLFSIASFLLAFDLSTVYPLLLWLLEEGGVEDKQWEEISKIIESYAVRRAICGLTSRNYNRLFLSLMRHLSQHEVTAMTIRSFFSSQSGPSAKWPNDREFRDAWLTKPAYHAPYTPQTVHILRRLNGHFYSDKTEAIRIDSKLSTEHILPRKWIQNWLLPSGNKGLTREQMQDPSADPTLVQATGYRDDLLDTIGNLTILTQELNSAISNASWVTKRKELDKFSVLPINKELVKFETWDEDAIKQRSEQLFEIAIRVWPDLVGSST